jgi:hypothetical protein
VVLNLHNCRDEEGTMQRPWFAGSPKESGVYWCIFKGEDKPDFVVITEIGEDKGDFIVRTIFCEADIKDIAYHMPVDAPAPPAEL